jgi:hypothetical protein
MFIVKFHICQSISLLYLNTSFQFFQIIMQAFYWILKLNLSFWWSFIYLSYKLFSSILFKPRTSIPCLIITNSLQLIQINSFIMNVYIKI